MSIAYEINKISDTIMRLNVRRKPGSGRGASHKTVLFSYSIVAPRSDNCIYRPVTVR